MSSVLADAEKEAEQQEKKKKKVQTQKGVEIREDIHLFNFFNTFLWCSYCVLGTVLGARNTDE